MLNTPKVSNCQWWRAPKRTESIDSRITHELDKDASYCLAIGHGRWFSLTRFSFLIYSSDSFFLEICASSHYVFFYSCTISTLHCPLIDQSSHSPFCPFKMAGLRAHVACRIFCWAYENLFHCKIGGFAAVRFPSAYHSPVRFLFCFFSSSRSSPLSDIYFP